MNEEIDLDIDNYDLEDILRLFKMPANFEEEDMKRAKQVVLKTHPDKSRLPAKFFIFYSKAYKVLYQVYEFRNKSSKKSQPENYEDVMTISTGSDGQDNNRREKALATFFNTNEKLKEARHFNKWFNSEFEKNRLEKEEDGGYGEWLSSDQDVAPEKKISLTQMGEEIAKKKSELRAIIPVKEVEDLQYSQGIQGTSLSTQGPSEFSSDLFSSLPYQDLRQAHVTSVIPVTEEDYYRVKKFNNVNELSSYRNSQDTKPLSERQAMEYLNRKSRLDDEQATQRAYDLAKQTEFSEKNNQAFWGNLFTIRGASPP
jgi:hypothetical protein